MDEDAMLEEMVLEEMMLEEGMMSKPDEAMDEDAALDAMLIEEGMGHDDEAEAMDDLVDEAEVIIDPMAMAGPEMGEDMMILAKLFGERGAADEKEEDAEAEAAKTIQEDKEHAAEDKKEESKKKASLRPQPKKASQGAKTLGGVSKSAASEVNDLSQLWESAPDVSKFF